MESNFRLFIVGASSADYRSVKQVQTDLTNSLNTIFLVALHSTFDSSNSYVAAYKILRE